MDLTKSVSKMYNTCQEQFAKVEILLSYMDEVIKYAKDKNDLELGRITWKYVDRLDEFK